MYRTNNLRLRLSLSLSLSLSFSFSFLLSRLLSPSYPRSLCNSKDIRSLRECLRTAARSGGPFPWWSTVTEFHVRRISRGRLGRIRVDSRKPRVRKKQFRYAFLMNVASNYIPKQIKEIFEIMDEIVVRKRETWQRDRRWRILCPAIDRVREEIFTIHGIYLSRLVKEYLISRIGPFYCIQDQKRLIASRLKYLLAASLTRKLDESPGRTWSGL